MSQPIIIFSFIILIIIAIVIASYVHVKEQRKIQRLQKIQQSRFKIRKSEEYIDFFSSYPIGIDAFQILFNHIYQEYKVINSLNPTEKSQKDVNNIAQRMQNFLQEQNISVTLPNELEKIKQVIDNLSVLVNYLIQVSQQVDSENKPLSKAVHFIRQTQAFYQAQLILKMANNEELLSGSSQKMLEEALTKLHHECNTEASYVKKSIAQIEELLESIKQKAQPQTNTDMDSTFGDGDNEQNQDSSTHDLDIIFGEKRKW